MNEFKKKFKCMSSIYDMKHNKKVKKIEAPRRARVNNVLSLAVNNTKDKTNRICLKSTEQ